MPLTTTCAIIENDKDKRLIQKAIREFANENNIACFDIPKDIDLIQYFVSCKDMKKRYIFMDINNFDDQYNHKLVKNLLHGLAWVRNIIMFASVDSIHVFSPRMKYNISYIISQKDSTITLTDPENSNDSHSDLHVLLDVNNVLQNVMIIN